MKKIIKHNFDSAHEYDMWACIKCDVQYDSGKIGKAYKTVEQFKKEMKLQELVEKYPNLEKDLKELVDLAFKHGRMEEIVSNAERE